jgi:hypothetical protein
MLERFKLNRKSFQNTSFGNMVNHPEEVYSNKFMWTKARLYSISAARSIIKKILETVVAAVRMSPTSHPSIGNNKTQFF